MTLPDAQPAVAPPLEPRLSLPSRLRCVAELAVTLIRHPSLVREMPQWVREFPDRLDPLGARRPWWNFKARAFMASQVTAGDRVAEFGGGASTLWLMDQGCQVHTVEHVPAWLEALAARTDGIADVQLVGAAEDDHTACARLLDDTDDGSLDLVLLDGCERVRRGLAARSKLKPGGRLLLDDSDRERYDELHAALRGWEAHHLRGLKVGSFGLEQTTVWIKPAHAA